MADETSKWDIAPTDRSGGYAFAAPAQRGGLAFPSAYLSVESGDYKVPRVSGGLSKRLDSSTSLELGAERIPTDSGSSYGVSAGLRKAF